ncbi:LuxR C-terminal-related transcriptional regulator [Streptomyces sp. SP18BB07]|nr:LuxR C-terminal-related transcriptional regulator [Streptomyces sp. SP18BB07]MEE1765204.1 LuxR C-terminal-related transcriptional regulator [Streptomyces sp. SP18BB07]
MSGGRFNERLAHAHALWTLGYDAWIRGDHDGASILVRNVLENEQGFNDYNRVALMLEELAWITAARGDREEAARLLGAARTLWRDTDTTIATFGPHMVEQHARCEDDVVGTLGPAAYEQTLTEGGRHRGPDEAIAYALRARPEPTAAALSPSPLTPREREVAALVAHGMSNRQIASALGRSPRTVHGHVENILAKLGFASRPGSRPGGQRTRCPPRRTTP